MNYLFVRNFLEQDSWVQCFGLCRLLYERSLLPKKGCHDLFCGWDLRDNSILEHKLAIFAREGFVFSNMLGDEGMAKRGGDEE